MIGPFEPMPAGIGIAPPRCHPPPDGGTLRHVNNSLPGPLSEGSVHGNGSRQPDNWLSALAEPFVTVLAHGNGVIVTKANSLGVLPHLECVWLRRLHFCCFHWTRRSLPKKFSWDRPKTRPDFEKCPEQKDKSLRTPFASNYDRNRL